LLCGGQLQSLLAWFVRFFEASATHRTDEEGLIHSGDAKVAGLVRPTFVQGSTSLAQKHLELPGFVEPATWGAAVARDLLWDAAAADCKFLPASVQRLLKLYRSGE